MTKKTYRRIKRAVKANQHVCHEEREMFVGLLK